jgi:N-acetyl sugar amidotransferase
MTIQSMPLTVDDDVLSDRGLPLKVKYCAKCVESNQRFIVSVPHGDKTTSKKDTITFDEDGVCSACRYFVYKRTVDWAERERELVDLLARHKRKDGYYDILIPGSGGKDSRYTAHLLKHKYGMNPLTVTWAPHMYTDVGWRNFESWMLNGIDNILFTPNQRTHRKLTRLAFENLLHPFQPFAIGQYNLAPRLAMEKGIKLIMFGDFAPETGTGSADISFNSAKMDSQLFCRSGAQDLFLGGVHINDLGKHGISQGDLLPYMPIETGSFLASGVEAHFLPYYLNYDPQKMYYFAVEHTGFEANSVRTEGTYTKYQSLDDKADGFHHFTWYIKTGRGRATQDSALECRNAHITREEAVALVRRFDGEFPSRYFKDFLDYVDLSEEGFWKIVDSFRPSHLWDHVAGEWKLKQQVS